MDFAGLFVAEFDVCFGSCFSLGMMELAGLARYTCNSGML
jgi:hypothetical protein